MDDAAILRLHAVTRRFAQGGEQVDVLRGIDLTVRCGEIVALIGASGSGKSSLLQIAGLLDTPSSGDVTILGAPAFAGGDAARTLLRRRHLGFIYQFHHLLPEFSALENVAMPRMIAGQTFMEAAEAARALLGELGLKDRLHHRPAALSGGEQQRVAIARALVTEPALILADEPTGNLDPEMAESVFDLFLRLARARGLSALVATHNLDLARRMDRVVQLRAGRLG